jgi:serine/threonine protein kinase
MTPERYGRLCELFDQVQQKAPSERAAFIQDACAGDSSLRSELESLLAHDERARGEQLLQHECLVNAKELLTAEKPILSRSPMWRGLETTPQQGDAWLGQQIGPYQIEQRLGSGGMGDVYKAHDTRLSRSVALKFLAAEYAQDQRALERFYREARLASALNHPHIVTIYDIDAYEGQPFIAMEFVQGQTLRELARRRLSLEALIPLAEQVAKALALAHTAGIAHRDIKPDNILVRDDGYVKVVDFGLARPLPRSVLQTAGDPSHLTDPGILVGTLRYMSPEQGRAEAASSASDIFALGIVLYELATGHHPFEADSQIAVLHGILSQVPVPPSHLNPEISAPLEFLLLGMLEKDARLRPTAAEVGATLAALSRTGASRPLASVRTPVQRHTVGRQQEHRELRAALESATTGQGLLLCIAGEAGMGKTTLVEEFLDEAGEGHSASIARGRCSERLAGAEAYLPFLEALESLLRSDLGDQVARVLKVVAPTWYVQLAPLAAEDSSFERVRAEAKTASQERLKRELIAALQEVTRLCPLILFLDDLHWADVSTVDLLAYLGSKCATMRLLVVLAYRSSDLFLSKHPFWSIMLDLQGRGICREIRLPFLSRPDIERYLALRFPEHGFSETFPALIHTRTEGNPLFMVDLLRYLRERGVIAQVQGRWMLTQALADIHEELPESVRSMIHRKIDQLDEEDRRVLIAASVQGQEFDAAVVSQALGVDAAELEERLQALERAHAFVQQVAEKEFPDGTLTLHYRFVHILYQNELFALLAPARKVSLSAAVAQALLGYYAEHDSAVAAELAILFETARDSARASDYFLLASQNAARVCANQEAVALARWAMASAEKIRGKDRHTRLLAAAFHLGPLYQTHAQFQEAQANYELAEKVACESADAEAQVQAICGIAAALCYLGCLRECREQGKRALDLAQAAQSTVGVACAERILGQERTRVGDLDAVERLYDKAIPVLLEKGPPHLAVETVSHRGSVHYWRLENAQAERSLLMALEKARELGIGSVIVFSLFKLGSTFGNQGRLSEALETLREGLRLAELHDERHWHPRLPNTLGWVYRELQDLETALRLDSEGVQLAREMADGEAETNSRINLGHDYLALGEPARAWEQLQAVQAIPATADWLHWRYTIRLHAELTSYWIVRGDLQAAAAHVATSLQLAEKTLARKHMAWARKLFGDLAVLEERLDDAQREYATALAILQRHPCPTIEWKILESAAEAAKRQKNDTARDDFRGRSLAVIQSLATGLHDDRLRDKFLAAKAIRDLGS